MDTINVPRRKKKKKKKSRKVGRADVYVEDSLPDGISDDEKKSKKKKKKKLAVVDEDADPDSLDLSQIDLTAPLRKDEVMPQRQHRVVEAAPRAEPDWAAPPSKPKKSSKKEKKAKKSKKKKGGAEEEDLLGFGTASPPPPAPTGDVFDLLGTGDAPPAPAPPVDALLGPSLDLSPGQTSPSDFAQLLASTDGWCSSSVRVKRTGASEDAIGAVA